MTPSGATHMERATLPTRVALVPNVFAIQSVVYCPWHFGAIVTISVAASKAVLIRFHFMIDALLIHLLEWVGYGSSLANLTFLSAKWQMALASLRTALLNSTRLLVRVTDECQY